MTYLENKRILILSPQAWGTMFLSKHHYAVELAKKGNTVYFLNPPDEGHQQIKSVHIEEIKGYDTLYLVTHRLFFPYNIKFRFISFFHFLMKWQVKKILKAIGKPVDIIWSFDLGNIYPFSLFPKETKKYYSPR
ncbi:MAG: hypothetical protein HC867_04930 [Bacteroidia bacterium]|nr:hypothetical protein [Bacteroidia bacterium]